jgi:hypothetical protein
MPTATTIISHLLLGGPAAPLDFRNHRHAGDGGRDHPATHRLAFVDPPRVGRDERGKCTCRAKPSSGSAHSTKTTENRGKKLRKKSFSRAAEGLALESPNRWAETTLLLPKAGGKVCFQPRKRDSERLPPGR